MARKRRRTPGTKPEPVTLFPFLSILACVIGVLVLGISCTILMQLSGIDIDRLENEIDRLKGEIIQLTNDLPDDIQSDEDLDTMRHEIRRYANAGQANEEKDDLQESIDQQQAIYERLRHQYEAVADEHEVLEEELNRPATIVSGGSATDLVPFFIECEGDTIFIHNLKKRVNVSDLESTDGPYEDILETVKATDRGSIVFLVRPDAIKTYDNASSIARSKSASYGSLPLPEGITLDLTEYTDEREEI